MAWTFDSVVESGRDRDQASGRQVYYAKGLFLNGSEQQCITTFWYDTAPTTQQRTARLNEILARLNAPPADEPIDDAVLREIRSDLIEYAKRTGKTKAEIIAALRNLLNN